ncbi:MAG TPA: hypothetical protein VF306_06390 [Pirellulales bacterium]
MRLAAITLLVMAWSTSSALARHGHMRGMSPRGGGAFAIVSAYQSQMAAWMKREQIAANIRQAKTNGHRMKYAAEARKEGKLRLAATLYMRVALSRPKDKHHDEAKKALASMADDGRKAMKAGDELLKQDKVIEAFEKLDYLKWAYEEVPVFNHEVAQHVNKLHRDPHYQAVLNEPQAAQLLAAGRKHEQDDEACCAFLVYEQAEELLPAASAKQAAERLAALKKDPEIVAAADECRTVRKCLDTFHRAELVKKALPNRAEELFKEIITEAPRDSEVRRCAAEELAKLHVRSKPRN